MQVVVYAIRDLAIEATLNLLDHFNVIKLNIFTYTQLVFLNFDMPIINRRMDKGDFKHYTPLK